MIPLGALAYPSHAGTLPAAGEITSWKKAKQSGARKIPLEVTYLELFDDHLKSSKTSKDSNHLQAYRNKRSLGNKTKASKGVPWSNKPIPLARSTTPTVASFTYGKTLYQSIYISPTQTFPSRNKDCLTLPRFSWQSHKPRPKDLLVKARHVEILIPSWAHPIHPLPIIPISPSFSTHCRRFPRPPKALPERVFTKKMSESIPNGHQFDAVDSGLVSTSNGRPLLHLRDPGTAAFPSLNVSHNGSQSSLGKSGSSTPEQESPKRAQNSHAGSRKPPMVSSTNGQGVESGVGNSPFNNMSGLVCNVHHTTGTEPPSLVGASTTISGDKLYVFGGRQLSRRRPQLTRHLYELDLVQRHWTKVETRGNAPAPRYFHSTCALGDTKLVCYGGMAQTRSHSRQESEAFRRGETQRGEPEITVMSDVHFYDIPSRTWTAVPVAEAPQGRYAHCATILPSSAVFTSATAPLSAIHHNPASSIPNQGSIGVAIDGRGGAEMIVVGGQDNTSQYIEQVSVFNLRSLKWTTVSKFPGQYGAYRTLVAPLAGLRASQIGRRADRKTMQEHDNLQDEDTADTDPAVLIYSNYNFLNVELKLQVRLSDGTVIEKPMRGSYSPPGLRFPGGGVVDNHFVVGGIFITSTKQEHSLWALDLRSLTWSRIDTGSNSFTSGSWNRGILWNRRNAFVILGDRTRTLADDYNQRRTNFADMCIVELEAFGLYNNPWTCPPNSEFVSASSPVRPERSRLARSIREYTDSAKDLGRMTLGIREVSNMELLAFGGERIPVNAYVIAQRWGPYFNRLLQESIDTQERRDSENGTLSLNLANYTSRNSSITITPSVMTSLSNTTTAVSRHDSTRKGSQTGTATTINSMKQQDPLYVTPTTRPRLLYLPHTDLTIRALVHYLYTSALPPTDSILCTPQILCSLLQLARPYQINGLLEATVERLHQVLDGRNTAAIFNAAAMAAGGGDGVAFVGDEKRTERSAAATTRGTLGSGPDGSGEKHLPNNRGRNGRQGAAANGNSENDGLSSGHASSSSMSGTESSEDGQEQIWKGGWSAVVGLQKRGLRGLMEGRRLRERGISDNSGTAGPAIGSLGSTAEAAGVGLGIA